MPHIWCFTVILSISDQRETKRAFFSSCFVMDILSQQILRWDGSTPSLGSSGSSVRHLCTMTERQPGWLRQKHNRTLAVYWDMSFAVLDLTHTNHNAAVKKLIRFEWFFKSQWRSRNQKPLKHNLTFISPSLLLMSDTGVCVDAVMSYCKFLLFLLPKMYYTLSKETLKWALQIVFEAVLIQWICSLWDPSVLRSHQIFIFTAT